MSLKTEDGQPAGMPGARASPWLTATRVCSSAWLEHSPDKREVIRSSRIRPTGRVRREWWFVKPKNQALTTLFPGDVAQPGERCLCKA
jgi:hypothetical protein